jgi:radical SAM superfamily enzyme YgiQ (UPF0313 family)
LYAASILRDEGFEVSLFDSCLAHNTSEFKQRLDEVSPELLLIYDDGFNYLTKMCLTNMREAAFEMIGMGRDRGIRVIVSSSDSSDHYREYLERGADHIIIGEGENTLQVMARALTQEDSSLDSIRGTATKNADGEIVLNKPRPVIKDLDSLPMPAWDLVEMDRYKSIWKKNHHHFSLNIATTRGCPYKCNWCAKPIYGYEYNSRSPENVVQEISYLVREHEVDHFWVCDDIFGLKKDWIRTFRELLEKENLKITYTVQSRADLVIKEGIAEDMASSGASIVWLGAESGSQKVLDAMNKGQTIEQIRQAHKILKQHKIATGLFLQFGYPGEEREDIDLTID